MFTLGLFLVDECKHQIARRETDSPNDRTHEVIVANDVLDHYLLFNRFEPYLQTPFRLKDQLVFQITEEVLKRLIEMLNKFFSFI